MDEEFEEFDQSEAMCRHFDSNRQDDRDALDDMDEDDLQWWLENRD